MTEPTVKFSRRTVFHVPGSIHRRIIVAESMISAKRKKLTSKSSFKTLIVAYIVRIYPFLINKCHCHARRNSLMNPILC